MDKLVTVCIPVYNAENRIARTFRCLLEQTYSNIEIIVVNDGSTDSTVKVLDTLRKQDIRIHIITKENGGVSEARNVAISQAKGAYICFVDDDDIVTPNYIESMVNAMERSKADFCVASFKEQIENKGIVESIIDHSINGGVYSFIDGNIDSLLLEQGFLHPCWGKLYKTDIIQNVGIKFPDINLSEDSFFVLDYLKECKEFVTIEDSLYIYCHEKNKPSLSTAMPANIFEIYVSLHQRYYDFLDLCSRKHKAFNKNEIEINRKSDKKMQNFYSAVDCMLYAQYYSAITKVFENKNMTKIEKRNMIYHGMEHPLVRKSFGVSCTSITIHLINYALLHGYFSLAEWIYKKRCHCVK